VTNGVEVGRRTHGMWDKWWKEKRFLSCDRGNILWYPNGLEGRRTRKMSLWQMVVRCERENMPRNTGGENKSGFEVVIGEICSGIQMDWKVTELVKGPCDGWWWGVKEKMSRNTGGEDKRGFEVVIGDIRSGIWVDWKVAELVKGPCDRWWWSGKENTCYVIQVMKTKVASKLWSGRDVLVSEWIGRSPDSWKVLVMNGVETGRGTHEGVVGSHRFYTMWDGWRKGKWLQICDLGNMFWYLNGLEGCGL
jgi:hypothetical protein